MAFPVLETIGEPFVFIRMGAREMVVSAEYGNEGIVVRKLRGGKCTTLKNFMSEVGAALQFFDGFGRK